MKKILLFILLLIPFIVNASCDNSEIVRLGTLAGNITYETNYIESSSSYKVTLYNVTNEMRIYYNNKTYFSDSNNEVNIDNVSEGTSMVITVYPKDQSCRESLLIIRIKLKYYNKFYNDSRCQKYIESGCKTTYCVNQFLDVKPTEKLFLGALENGCGDPAIEVPDPEVPEDEDNKLLELLIDIGIKFGLIAISLGGSIWFFTSKYRKMKHGI